jgi:hypothetical protein
MSQKICALSLATVALIILPNLVSAEQVIIQSGSSSASARGNNNFAASRVNQSARQNKLGNGNPNQLIIQKGNVNSTAVGANNGANNTAINLLDKINLFLVTSKAQFKILQETM